MWHIPFSVSVSSPTPVPQTILTSYAVTSGGTISCAMTGLRMGCDQYWTMKNERKSTRRLLEKAFLTMEKRCAKRQLLICCWKLPNPHMMVGCRQPPRSRERNFLKEHYTGRRGNSLFLYRYRNDTTLPEFTNLTGAPPHPHFSFCEIINSLLFKPFCVAFCYLLLKSSQCDFSTNMLWFSTVRAVFRYHSIRNK